MKNLLGDSELVFSDISIMLSYCFALLLTASISGLYYFWSFLIIKRYEFRLACRIRIIEDLFFLLLLMATIILTGKNESPYKVILLFIIIPITIQYGLRAGIISSVACSGFLFAVDMVFTSTRTVNRHLENDIILSAVFIITAWFLGYYVKLENEYRVRLENKANIDALTGLYNHSYFYDELIERVKQYNGKEPAVSLILLDIDNFKEYNDIFGHLKGDDVLKAVGETLRSSIDGDALIARYGGDEFALVFSGVDEKQLLDIGERIRNAVENTRFEGQEHLSARNLTVSIGVARCGGDINNHIELIKSADDALYRAKFFRKNRVEIYSSILDLIKLDIEKEHIDLITSIKTLISVINAKDRYTYGHVERVVIYSKMLADKLALNERDKNTLIYGAYMHDIGKISIPEDVLNKQRPLTGEEWDMIRQHPENGVKIVKQVDSLSHIIPLIRHHHERYDGKGYPEGLSGEKIPYLARVLTVVDSFDAMTSNRTYKHAKTFAEAIDELKACSWQQFDGEIVEKFVEVMQESLHNTDSYIPYKRYLMDEADA